MTLTYGEAVEGEMVNQRSYLRYLDSLMWKTHLLPYFLFLDNLGKVLYLDEAYSLSGHRWNDYVIDESMSRQMNAMVRRPK